MRFVSQVFFALLTVTFAHNLASASQGQEVLADLLSPDEVATEMGFSPAEGYSTTFEGGNERLIIVVDKSLEGTTPTAQSLQIYLDGTLIQTLAVSTGREQDEVAKSGKKYFSYTPVGSFKITHRNRDYFSETWQAPMPFAEFFVGGIAIHATTKTHYAELGKRASGGCVRVTYENAKMIWELIDQVGVAQVRINVVGHDKWNP